MPSAESDAYFADRPLDARIATAVSEQSQFLDHEQTLRARKADVAGAPPRPDSWSWYALEPQRIEFWHGRPDRLDRRLEYRRHGTG